MRKNQQSEMGVDFSDITIQLSASNKFMLEKILINKCPRCGQQHTYEIEENGIKEGISINLACLNIQRYHRLTMFHFD